jgi:hypothetical protein
MRRPRAAKWVIGAIVLFLAISAAFTLWFFRAVSQTLVIDYGKRPPAQVFRTVFRQPMPHGISDLMVAGHGILQGHTVVMRFRATDGAIRHILKRAAPVEARDFLRGVPEALSTGEARRNPRGLNEFDRDALKVHLDEAAHLRHASYYWFDASKSGQGWMGYIAIDPDRKFVYVVAQIL